MGSSLDRTPVLAERNGRGVDAVHDALVVGDGTEGIAFREAARPDDTGCELDAADIDHRHAATDGHHALEGQVREDTEADPSAQEPLDVRRQSLGHGVDEVCTHRVAHFNVDMYDD